MSDAEAKIRSLLDELQLGVAAKDLDTLVALFDDEVVLFGTAGTNIDRREAISYLARVVAQQGTIRWQWDTVLPLVDESRLLVFAVVGTVGLESAAGGADEQRDEFRMTAVAVNRDGRWRLTHFHGSVPDAV